MYINSAKTKIREMQKSMSAEAMESSKKKEVQNQVR